MIPLFVGSSCAQLRIPVTRFLALCGLLRRSISIFDGKTGEMVWDSGDFIEKFTADPANGVSDIFNSEGGENGALESVLSSVGQLNSWCPSSQTVRLSLLDTNCEKYFVTTPPTLALPCVFDEIATLKLHDLRTKPLPPYHTQTQRGLKAVSIVQEVGFFITNLTRSACLLPKTGTDTFDGRSDDKGAEPEGLVMAEINGRFARKAR